MASINVEFAANASTSYMRECAAILFLIQIAFMLRIVVVSQVNDEDGADPKHKHSSKNGNSDIIPFFYIPPLDGNESEPPFLDLIRTLDRYQSNVDDLIASMVRSVDIARKSEWMIWPDDPDDEYGNADNDENNNNEKKLSHLLNKRIASTVEALESDAFVLEKLLQPFHIVKALPFQSNVDDSQVWQRYNRNNRNIHQASKQKEESCSSYESAMQIVTHIVRDWSSLGAGVRHSLYSWCIDQLVHHFPKHPFLPSRVLVPGAGLGRLAYDIASEGYSVEANEISLVMSAVAHKLLHHQVDGIVYPFAFDHLTNEVDSANRYQSVPFPDIKKKEHIHNREGSLSYTIGNFVEIYSTKEQKGHFGAVVTCFFIDTATNIYEYLLVIKNVLKNGDGGGIWINVGPLQWHQNAKLFPSSDELRLMIEAMGFTILTWSVDEKSVNYRHDDANENARFTKYEGYRPLRFIAILDE